jgi:ribonuclease HI
MTQILQVKHEKRLVLYTDGGSRLRGKRYAAAAAVLTDGEQIIEERSRFLGELTNNQAEYHALLIGLDLAHSHGAGELVCISDSQLMVRQLNGEYKVKNAGLRDLFGDVVEKISKFGMCLFVHAPREHPMIQRADQLVNETLDEVWDHRKK